MTTHVSYSATSMSSSIAAYRAKWPARAPNMSRQRFDDETKLVKSIEFPLAPATGFVSGTPPQGRQPDENSLNTKYLWVVSTDSVPCILENGDAGIRLKRKSVSHTNLTGGKDAHCGGEMWFKDDRSIWLCGGSSRYRPRSSEELEEIAEAVRMGGYDVVNMGWDEETNSPARFYRAES